MGAEAQHWASQNRKQQWLPPCDNYITRVLLQSDTAGHYRALGDQVNMVFKLEVHTRFAANCRELTKIYQ